MYFGDRHFSLEVKLQNWLWSLQSLDTLPAASIYLLPPCVRKEFLQKHFISGLYNKFQAIVGFHPVTAVHKRELRIIKITALEISHGLNNKYHLLGTAHCICAMSNWTHHSLFFHMSALLSSLTFSDDSSCLSWLPVGVLSGPSGNYNDCSSC